MICKRFERWGWEIYKSKARCPQHADQRRRQKAHFARLNEEAETMPELVKTPPPRPNGTHPATGSIGVEAVERTYLLTIAADGTATLRPLEGVQEMLFGDTSYLVVPRD